MARKRAASQSPWYDALDAIVAPLNAYRKAQIRKALSRKRSTQLIGDWPRLSEIVWWHALIRRQMHINKGNTPGDRAIERKALKATSTALKQVQQAIDKYVATSKMSLSPAWQRSRVGRAVLGDMHSTPDEFASAVKASVQDQRERIEWFLRLNAGPTFDARNGAPIAAQTYMLQVLLAYFRHHKWDDTIPPTNFAAGPDGSPFAKESLFVKTACAALGLEGLSSETRKFLSQPSLWAYEAFEQMTPSPLTKKRKQEFLAHYGL